MKKYFNVIPANELGFFSISRKMKVEYRQHFASDTTLLSAHEREWSILNSIDEIQ